MTTALRTHDVVVDGIRLNVVEAGEGPALLLLHGVSASHENWEFTIPAFADRFRVIAPDLPGHGRSAKPDAPYTMDFYAGVVRSLGHALGVREAVVVGNSLGGEIAIELALSYPLWTRALVLAAPAVGFGTPLQSVGWTIGAVAGPRILKLALPLALERCFYDPSSPGHAERQRILAERLAADDCPSFARAVARSISGAIAAGRQPLDGLTQPTLVVWGRDDRMRALSTSRRLAREMGHARFAVLERCGHLPMLERPAEFNALVAEFLRAVDAAPLPGARRATGAS
jgi:pimeloyl-ACP methyl ester carboxylesterase